MTITEIIETPNKELEKMKILKEKMDLYVEGVLEFLLNYRNKLSNLYLFNIKLPEYDVIITNPPYSGDHIEKLFNFCKK